MPLRTDFAEHIKFWFALGDKIVDAVIREERNIIQGRHDGIKYSEDREDEVFSKLSKYCEVDRVAIESFYHLEDTGALQEHANELILWMESARKEFIEIRIETMDLEKKQKKNEDNDKAMSVIFGTLKEMNEQRGVKILSFELRVRAILSLVMGLNQRRAHKSSQISETTTIGKGFHDTATTVEQPRNSCHLANDIESEPSSAQIELNIATISNGLTSLANNRNSYETRLRRLREDIENDVSLSRPAHIRPVEITHEDIYKTATSIVESSSELITQEILHDLSEAVQDGHRNLAQKLHDDLEMPLRTIALQIKRYKINPAAILQEF